MQMTGFKLINASLNKLDEDDRVKVTRNVQKVTLYDTYERCRLHLAHSRTACGDFYLHLPVLSHFIKFNKMFPDK